MRRRGGDIWREMAERTLLSADRLRKDGDSRGCVSRSYYAVYQACTAMCISHGDAAQFPNNWGNPSHDQLPDLIRNNGQLPLSRRRRLVQHLNTLRSFREDADYRPGRTVDDEIALECLQRATESLDRLEEL